MKAWAHKKIKIFQHEEFDIQLRLVQYSYYLKQDCRKKEEEWC